MAVNQPQMNKVVWNNFFAGIDPADVKNNLGTSVFGSTETWNRPQDTQFASGIFSTNITPFRNFGILQPSLQKTNVTNMASITDTPRSIAVRNAAGGEAYMITSGAKLHKITGTTFDTVANAGIWPHTITGAVNGYDCMIAKVNTTEYLLYTYDQGAYNNRYVGYFDLTSTFTEGTLALSPAPFQYTSWLPMCVGEDLNFYIGTGNKIDKIAYNAAIAVSTGALVLPSNMVISSIRPYRGYLAIAAFENQALSLTYAKGRCAVYFWKYGAEGGNNFSDVVYISDNLCGDLVVKDGQLYLFTGENDGYARLRVLSGSIYNGSSFNTVCAFDRGVPNHNATDVYRNTLIWGGTGDVGRTWAYGSPDGIEPNSLQQIDGGATGFVKVLTTVGGYHYHIAGSASLAKCMSAYGASSIWQSMPRSIPHRSNLRRVTIHFLPLATAGGTDRSVATVKYASNNCASFTTLGTIDYTIDGAIDHKTFNFVKDTNNSPVDVDTFLMRLEFNTVAATTAVQIKSVEVYYESPIGW